jgi:phospholipase/carboxylesterase
MTTLLLLLLLQGKKTSESGLEYTVNGPKPGAKKSPVMIFLHGTGGNAGVWGTWAAEARKRNYVVVLPQSSGVGDRKAGNTNGDNLPRWADVDIPKVVSLARQIQREWGGDPRRTYIGGYSNGGFYAMEIGLRHPEVFSAILCVGGGANLSPGEGTKHLGAYIIHGTADNSVPFDVGKQAADKLKNAGLEVVFREYKGRGHDIFDEEAKAFFDWLPKFARPYTPGAGASGTLEEALKSAAEKQTLVWAWFWSKKDDKSAVAEAFELDLLTDPAVAELAKSYVLVKVERETNDLKITKPTLAVLSADGKILKRFEAPLAAAAFVAAVKKLK